MESDDENNNNGKKNNNQEFDSSVGALVWVRRRNGSWWPSQILGVDELSKSCLRHPRSGTPIKLLGKEDGSVDWYNLEKSTRIKAFRCGEYADFIERAKEHALCSKRKRANTGKYVRREEAILHALDLEENKKFGYQNNSPMVTTDKNIGPQSNLIGHKNKHKKPNKKSRPGIAYEDPNRLAASEMRYIQKKRRKTPNDSEDDTTEGMKRMRDLQDLGLGKILKREPNERGQTNDEQASPSDFDNDLSSDSLINSSRDSCSSLKRKRPIMAQAYESLKKKCRSLEEVWKGATKVRTPSLFYRGDFSEEIANIKVRGEKSASKKIDSSSAIDCSPDCSGTSCEAALLNTHENTSNAASGGTRVHCGMNNNMLPNVSEYIDDGLSDGIVDVPTKKGHKAADLSPTSKIFQSTKPNSGTKDEQSNHCIKVGLTSHLNEGLAEACSTSSSSHKLGTGPSDWHTKGKRNVRYLSLNKNLDSETIIDRTTQKETPNTTSNASLTSDSSCQQIKITSVSEAFDAKPKISIPAQVSLPPRKIRLPLRYRVLDQNSSQLYDVELNVQSNYNGQRVPLVSLMSKFNGKPIVGHPIPVEILGSGTSVSRSNKKSSNRKRSSISARKIRRLSSFAAEHKKKEALRKLVVDKIVCSAPAVSCIPLRLVFSRLNEALSNSARAAN